MKNLTAKTVKKTWVDIGANHGKVIENIIEVVGNTKQVIAVEPIPELAKYIRQRFNGRHVVVNQFAIGTKEGLAVLNLSRVGDWGISSLSSLKDENISEVWKGRQDLVVTERIDVPVVSLFRCLEENNVDVVEFIKIDAQGRDLDVIKSAGQYMSRIESGVLEVATTAETALYKGAPTVYDALTFLEENGFKIHKIKPNDPGAGEMNIWFVRSDLDVRNHFQDTKVSRLNIYTENDTRQSLNDFRIYHLVAEIFNRTKLRIKRFFQST